MKRLTASVVVAMIALTAMISWSADAPKPVRVKIDKMDFSPNELTIPVGTTVTWENADDVAHTATGRGKPPPFDSKSLDTGKSYSFTFAKAGTYEYFCRFHKSMTGKIVVK